MAGLADRAWRGYQRSVRTVFFGTPSIAVPALEALAATTDLVAVVCQPDRRAGRGMRLAPPAIKEAALRLGVPVHQPSKVRTGALAAWLVAQNADVAVVMAYGRILTNEVLCAPRKGCVNLHASLLPKYRGAAPINWAIYNGETSTGVALMQMEEGLDTGPVFTARSTVISPEDNAEDLALKLAKLAAVVVKEDLLPAVSGQLQPTKQDESIATYAPLIEKHHLTLDWTKSAPALVNQVRAFAERPGARTWLPSGKLLKVLRASARSGASSGALGEILPLDMGTCAVQTGDGVLLIEQAQVEGKRPMSAQELLNGRMVTPGWRLSTASEASP